MKVGIFNFTVLEGADVSREFRLTNKDNSVFHLRTGGENFVVRMQARSNKESSDPLITTTGLTPNATIVMSDADATAGLFYFVMTAVQTGALDFVKAFHDFEIVHPSTGVVTRLLEGRVSLSKEITR